MNKLDRKNKFALKFINDASVIHNNLYSYNIDEYNGMLSKVNILCKTHGYFRMQPSAHVGGQGCPRCGHERKGKSSKYNSKIFIKKAILKHNNFYSYEKVDYVNSTKKVIITCPEHGEFAQSPSEHLRGYGCSACSYHLAKGWKLSSWKNYCDRYCKKFAYVYVINIFNENESFIKIGITTDSIENRFTHLYKHKYNYNIISAQRLRSEDAFLKEKYLHKKYSKNKYIPLNRFSGYTECFRIDIINDFQI